MLGKRTYADGDFGSGGEIAKFVKKEMASKDNPGTANTGGSFSVSYEGITAGDTGQFHRNGTLIWCYRRPSVRAELFFDTQTIASLCIKQAQFKMIMDSNKGIDKRQIDEKEEQNKKNFHAFLGAVYDSKSPNPVDIKVFTDLDKFREVMAVAGVRTNDPGGYASNLNGSYQNQPPMNPYAIAFNSREIIHSGYFDPPYDIGIGSNLWLIVKMVPLSYCTDMSPMAESYRSRDAWYDYEKEEKAMTIAILYYVAPVGGGPPPLDADMKIFKNADQQPSLYSPEYKIFDDPSNPKKFTLKCGFCVYLGKSIKRISSRTDVPYAQRTRVPTFAQKDVIKTDPIDVFLKIEPWYDM